MRKKNVYVVMEDWEAWYDQPFEHESLNQVIGVYSKPEDAKAFIKERASLFNDDYKITVEEDGWIVKAEADSLKGGSKKTGERESTLFPHAESYRYRAVEEEVK